MALPDGMKEVLRGIRNLRRRYADHGYLSFSPDGHLVGDLGVAHACDKLELSPTRSNLPSQDAVDADGRIYEVKATGGRAVAFRPLPDGVRPPDFLIVIKFDWDAADAEIVYLGSYVQVHQKLIAGRKWASNGQIRIALSKLRQLDGRGGPGGR